MSPEETELLSRAVEGEHLALQRLLIPYQRRLLARIERKLPAFLKGMTSPEDVLQEVYVEVFGAIRTFRPEGNRAFYRWLLTIADNRVIDIVRAQCAAKRGGGRQPVQGPASASTIMPLVELLHVDSHTPSRSAAGHEVVAAVHVALAQLKPDYREALKLRFLEGMSVSDTASKMKRSEWSVHKLCSRGLQQLRESLGEISRFLSRN